MRMRHFIAFSILIPFILSALSDTLSATFSLTIPWHMLCYDEKRER